MSFAKLKKNKQKKMFMLVFSPGTGQLKSQSHDTQLTTNKRKPQTEYIQYGIWHKSNANVCRTRWAYYFFSF